MVYTRREPPEFTSRDRAPSEGRDRRSGSSVTCPAWLLGLVISANRRAVRLFREYAWLPSFDEITSCWKPAHDRRCRLGMALHRPASAPIFCRGQLGRLASICGKPHIVGMATAKKKKAPSRRSGASKRAVLYRGVKIIPKTGKRSPIAKVIRDGLRTKSEQSHGETAQA